MPRQPIPALSRVCLHCGATWIQRDGRPPRDYCTTSCRNEAERQAHSPPGAASAEPEAPPERLFTRRVRARQYTITCARCGEVATLEQYPGARPRYCNPGCRAAAAREGAAERMRRMRARQQAATPVTRSE
jgi:hypothetical protein